MHRTSPVTRPACRQPLLPGGARSEENYRPRATPGGARSKENSGATSECYSHYLSETAFIDLRDLALNTRDGLHLAALAGAWLAAVAGFGGMRDYGKTLSFAPRLASRLTRLSFGLHYRGRRLRVGIDCDAARYELLDGKPLEILHHGESITATADSPQTRPMPRTSPRPAPQPPPGRPPNPGHG